MKYLHCDILKDKAKANRQLANMSKKEKLLLSFYTLDTRKIPVTTTLFYSGIMKRKTTNAKELIKVEKTLKKEHTVNNNTPEHYCYSSKEIIQHLAKMTREAKSPHST